MLKINNKTKQISINRGDDGVGFIFSIPLDEGKYEFQPGDIVTFGVYYKKQMEKNALILKNIEVDSATENIVFDFTKEETSIGNIENKPVECWYEIQLNQNTIIGYDADGPKIFMVYPEGSDIE